MSPTTSRKKKEEILAKTIFTSSRGLDTATCSGRRVCGKSFGRLGASESPVPYMKESLKYLRFFIKWQKSELVLYCIDNFACINNIIILLKYDIGLKIIGRFQSKMYAWSACMLYWNESDGKTEENTCFWNARESQNLAR